MNALQVYGETRRCSGCEQVKPIGQFTPFRDPQGRERRKPRCKPCVAKAQTEFRWRTGKCKARPPKTDTKVCKDCQQTLPVSAFEQSHNGDGVRFERAQCRACVNRRKRTLLAATRATRPPKPVVVRVEKPKPAPKSVLELHPCSGCGVGLSTRLTECVPCKRKRQAANHVGSDEKVRQRMHTSVLKRFSRGLYAGLMWLRDGDVWGMDYLCQGGCGRPQLVAGKCWTCATGKPRTLRRADGSLVPLPRCDVRDALEVAAA